MARPDGESPLPAAPLRVAVTGASGLLGTALGARLRAEGHTVLRLVRRAPRGPDEAEWDPAAGRIDAAALEGVDGVVNLAGSNVGQRWTEARKRSIRESRVAATWLLASALAGLERRPRVLVSASGVGIYGNRGDEVLHEESTPGDDFLAQVVREWEAATEPAAAAGIRVVRLRLGVVLSARGGALAKMLPAFRLGAGGPMGGGRQWMSWIALDDAVELFLRALVDEAMSGPVNAVAGATTNATFARALGRVLRRPALVPVPALALKLLFGEMAEGTILTSQRVEPRRLRALGHRFHHPALEDALHAALREEQG